MKYEENCGGGETVVLTKKDRLDSVPESHRHLLTPELALAFKDPVEYFQVVAHRCSFPEMKRWLLQLLAKPKWKLRLNMCNPDYGDWSLAGFEWSAKGVRGATIALPRPSSFVLPKTLQSYYALVDTVHFTEFGGAGGLYGVESLKRLTEIVGELSEVDQADEVYVWGSSGCGDMLVFTMDDRGGWFEHETGGIQWIGSLPETMDWIYAELLANREPERDSRTF